MTFELTRVRTAASKKKNTTKRRRRGGKKKHPEEETAKKRAKKNSECRTRACKRTPAGPPKQSYNPAVPFSRAPERVDFFVFFDEDKVIREFKSIANSRRRCRWKSKQKSNLGKRHHLQREEFKNHEAEDTKRA